MKANRKFLNGDDEAVSPVIAVILMVAITVVLAATVYVWVSGFGSSGTTPAKTMSLTSSGGIVDGNKTYVIASASPGLKWTDLDFTLDGIAMAYDGDGSPTSGTYCVWNPSAAACFASEPTSTIGAGAQLRVYHHLLSGQTLRILDGQANSVILTQPVS